MTFDNPILDNAGRMRWGPMVEGDVRDAAAVAQAIADHDTATVINLAADADVGEAVGDPARYYDNNVGGMIGLLAGKRRAGCTRIDISSTCAVYGKPATLPINEYTPAEPLNSYGRTKLICEQMLADHAAAYGMDYVALRYFDASGTDLDGELGEDRAYEPHLISRAVPHLLGRLPTFTVFGSDFPTPDGTAIRGYIHVADLAARIFWRCAGCSPAARRRVACSTSALAAVIRSPRCSLRSPTYRAGRSPRRVAVVTPATRRSSAPTCRARDELGFTARHSALRDIIASA